MAISAKLFNFNEDGRFINVPVYFSFDLQSDRYHIKNKQLLNRFMMKADGDLEELANSKATSESTCAIYYLVKEKVAELLEDVELRLGVHIYVKSTLCLRSADGKHFIPVDFAMTYSYNPARGCMDAFGSFRDHVMAVPSAIEDRFNVMAVMPGQLELV